MHKSTPEQFKKNNFFSRGFQLLYDAILLISLIGLLPYWMLRVWRGQLSKIAIAQRLGLSLPDLSNESKVLWVHAVSLGETKAVSALVQTLYERDKQLCIIISNVTQTGHEEAKRALPFAHHIFLPYDFTPIVHYSLKRLRPNWIMLVETDYWPNLLRLARLYDIKRCIVNAKLSEKSFRRLLPLSRWLHHPACSLELICVQDATYAKRLRQIGVDPDRIALTGNLKYDSPPKTLDSAELEALRNRLGISKEDIVLVAGSTHFPEEAMLLEVWKSLVNKSPRLKLVLVPRHPERFEEVLLLIRKHHLSHCTYTQSSSSDCPIVLIDTVGILTQCYQLADLALVGGSWTKSVGGHNLMEPCWFGVPTLFGPHTFQQREMRQLILETRAGMEIPEESLCKEIERLLSERDRRQTLGQAGKALCLRQKGALERTLQKLETVGLLKK